MTFQESVMANWAATFPNEVRTVQNSALFIKKLLAVAVSNITYLRSMFPGSAFGSRSLSDIRLKILSENSPCPSACKVIGWVKGCFEALDYKYLRQMMLGIHRNSNDHDNVIEAYTFRFSYTKPGVTSVSCNGRDVGSFNDSSCLEMKQATISLLRTLVLLTNTLDPLPPYTYLTMKLLYYDEVTPPDYEPHGFRPAMTDNFYFQGEPMNIRAGDISTPFHCLKVRVKTDKSQFDGAPGRDESGKAMTQTSCKSGSSVDMSFGTEESLNKTSEGSGKHDGGNKSTAVIGTSNDTAEEANVKGEKNDSKKEEEIVRCPCGYCKEEDLMISCSKCGSWQHGICCGVVNEHEASEDHVCEICYKKGEEIKPEEKAFYDLSPSDRQELCIWRRALLTVCDLKTVQINVLEKRLNVKKSEAHDIYERLEVEGYINPGPGRLKGRKYVDKSRIEKEAFPKYVKKIPSKGLFKHDITGDLGEKTRNLSLDDTVTFKERRGQKRGKEALKSFDAGSEELLLDGETRQKRQKASTCESGVQLQPPV